MQAAALKLFRGSVVGRKVNADLEQELLEALGRELSSKRNENVAESTRVCSNAEAE